ncbi:hypothetical protein BDV30DRAFT_231287 [Aspergillus minisclerotigenes]|uniref:Uncharacterized protein n=1 Tax=Aspergillus minisclerotigenes TaxID=656917 RepID=A0A5N6IM57_9EURO|nr:hypothetical protein BDV30DRAFT_231287 [Aspergillus minisclerotigenes]
MTEAHARKLAAELQGATREQAMAKVMEDADQNRLFELALSPEALNKWATLAFVLQSMAIDYDPSGSITSMDVFYCISLAVVASSKKQWRNEHLRKWVDIARSEPRFHEVGGAHYTMLGPEHVFNFQKTLRAALDARERFLHIKKRTEDSGEGPSAIKRAVSFDNLLYGPSSQRQLNPVRQCQGERPSGSSDIDGNVPDIESEPRKKSFLAPYDIEP